jgi:hypothetical protein
MVILHKNKVFFVILNMANALAILAFLEGGQTWPSWREAPKMANFQ